MHKDIREANLELAKTSEIKVIVSAEALTTGYDLPDLDAGICVSGVSSEIIGIQSLGRITRHKEGKNKPMFINLYCENTQEESWVKTKTKELNPL